MIRKALYGKSKGFAIFKAPTKNGDTCRKLIIIGILDFIPADFSDFQNFYPGCGALHF